jgi:septal ring factor EnvC (AmiA/AmiB activator)
LYKSIPMPVKRESILRLAKTAYKKAPLTFNELKVHAENQEKELEKIKERNSRFSEKIEELTRRNKELSEKLKHSEYDKENLADDNKDLQKRIKFLEDQVAAMKREAMKVM